MRTDAFEPMNPECKTCRYGDSLGGARDLFICRRHAPVPHENGVSMAPWPKVKADDWCAEYSEQF